MQGIPRARFIDASFQMLKDPYRFVSHECSRLQSNVFETRLLFEKLICMSGREAAQMFSDEKYFVRRNAVPEIVQATLMGKHGVQTLDREAHFHRKQMFLSILSPDNVNELQMLLRSWLHAYSQKWMEIEQVVLYKELQEVLVRTVFSWAGLELSDAEFEQRKNELTLLFDGAGSVRKHLKVRLARKSLESWMEEVIQDIRNNVSSIPVSSPISVVASFTDVNGELLSLHDAAVEVLNILRPPVAVSVYMVLTAHALHLYPEGRKRIKAQEAGYIDHFVNEVRRFYPFFPGLFAKVNEDFIWNEREFKKGTRVMLDLYGINHDKESWIRPQEFNPDRFKDWNGDRYSFVPQGVGDHALDHRCPGELLTIEFMRTFINFMTSEITYEVPTQNLFIDMQRLPALPKSQMIINNVRKQMNMMNVMELNL